MSSIWKYSLDAKRTISKSPITSSWIGEIRPSNAPMLIRTLAAAMSAPIMFANDNLISWMEVKKEREREKSMKLCRCANKQNCPQICGYGNVRLTWWFRALIQKSHASESPIGCKAPQQINLIQSHCIRTFWLFENTDLKKVPDNQIILKLRKKYMCSIFSFFKFDFAGMGN